MATDNPYIPDDGERRHDQGDDKTPYQDGDRLPDQDDARPDPEPRGRQSGSASAIAWIALVWAIAGCFLPTERGCEIPQPSPYVEPDGDPAQSEGAWVVVIEETAERTPETARVLGDLEFWRSLESRGLKWRLYDDDQQEAAAYRSIADEVGLPAVVIVADQPANRGKVLAKFRLPSSTELLSEQIQKATGR